MFWMMTTMRTLIRFIPSNNNNNVKKESGVDRLFFISRKSFIILKKTN
jgi:hypothetical protein